MIHSRIIKESIKNNKVLPCPGRFTYSSVKVGKGGGALGGDKEMVNDVILTSGIGVCTSTVVTEKFTLER